MTTPQTATELGWTVEGFAGFWAHPDINLVTAILADDVVGYWSGRAEPVHGVDDYAACIADLLNALPDVRLKIGEYAENGPHTFIRWIMHATGASGPFEMTGIDRIRVRDGKVNENYVVFDTTTFEKRAGIPMPWV
jgi:ketosteroid isomerase-like protein